MTTLARIRLAIIIVALGTAGYTSWPPPWRCHPRCGIPCFNASRTRRRGLRRCDRLLVGRFRRGQNLGDGAGRPHPRFRQDQRVFNVRKRSRVLAGPASGTCTNRRRGKCSAEGRCVLVRSSRPWQAYAEDFSNRRHRARRSRARATCLVRQEPRFVSRIGEHLDAPTDRGKPQPTSWGFTARVEQLTVNQRVERSSS
jgi:hypothetical protein